MAEVAFRQLRKQYPPRRGSAAVEVLKGIDLEVRDGEFLVLVGPSGCGKSTLLRLLAGWKRPVRGRWWWRAVMSRRCRHPAGMWRWCSRAMRSIPT